MCLSYKKKIQEISSVKVTWPNSGESDDGGVFKREETGIETNQSGDIFSPPQALRINSQNCLYILDPSNSNFRHAPIIEYSDSATYPALGDRHATRHPLPSVGRRS
jgi:hypothetical protein